MVLFVHTQMYRLCLGCDTLLMKKMLLFFPLSDFISVSEQILHNIKQEYKRLQKRRHLDSTFQQADGCCPVDLQSVHCGSALSGSCRWLVFTSVDLIVSLVFRWKICVWMENVVFSLEFFFSYLYFCYEFTGSRLMQTVIALCCLRWLKIATLHSHLEQEHVTLCHEVHEGEQVAMPNQHYNKRFQLSSLSITEEELIIEIDWCCVWTEQEYAPCWPSVALHTVLFD